ncbi:hypothetical protein Ahy_B06g082229 [Arachis hypogaea]|uniref:Uncharacterized protein n=1 Tax=Arachis hypogaea TaxID=3818 RepID=A0A444YN47_ARAHY|nr:hypothetical protein Ahy_B06g082229 [Arachis hypogaea]
MESRKRKQILEDTNSETKSESTDETQSKKRKHIIEDSSSEEEIHSYYGIPEVSLATETDPLFQGQMEQSSVNKPSDSMFSQEEESLSDPPQQQIIVFRSSSQPLDIVSIQLCMPSSKTTSTSPVRTIPPTESTPEPQKVDESTPTMPPAPSKIDPAPEAIAAALLMMARTASYVPKELPLPSFSLGLTDSSQEETQTQEGVGKAEAQVVKSLETTILIEELDVLVEKIAKSGEKTTPDFPEGKSPPNEKQTVGQIFDKFETPNMAIGNHPNGEFLQPKSKKPFNVEDYPMFIPFLDRKKLASHPYVIAVLFYVMKWLEIIEPQNLNKGKYEWDNWTQAEVDHFKVEFSSRILFHDMNRDRDVAIKGSETMRLSKPSAALLSSHCQVDSYDIESDSD